MEALDIVRLLLPFCITLAFNFGLMFILRRYETKHQHHVYTFFIVGMVIFFLCYTLRSFDLNLGMAIGLFAIFGIIRYRTEALSPQIISYLFATIGISVINALASGVFGWEELVIINALILLSIWFAERFFLKVKAEDDKEKVDILDSWEKSNIILQWDAEQESLRLEQAISDMERKLNIRIHHHRISKVDHLTNSVQVQVFYEAI